MDAHAVVVKCALVAIALQILAGHFREGDRLTVEPTKDGDLAFRREERKSQAA